MNSGYIRFSDRPLDKFKKNWVVNNSFVANTYSFFKTHDNALSLYKYSNSNEKQKIIAVYAVNRGREQKKLLEEINYSIISDKEIIEFINSNKINSNGISLKKVKGQFLINENNIVNNLHYDLISLDGFSLFNFINLMINKGDHKKCLRYEVAGYAVNCIKDSSIGNLDKDYENYIKLLSY